MKGAESGWADEAVLALRLHERQQEYRLRRMQLDLAAAGIPPAGVDPRAPNFGAREFAASIAGVDIEAALEVVDAVHVEGFAIAPLIGASTVQRIRQALEPLFESARRSASVGAHMDRGCHVDNLLAKTDVVDVIASAPWLRAILAGLLGYDFTMNVGVVAMEPMPGDPPQDPHRDDSFFPLLPRPRMPLVVTVVVALDDFTEASGATRMAPKSCLWPEPREPLAEELIHCEMPAGSMLIFDGGNYHGGGANRSTQRRRAVILNYTRGWLRAHTNHFLCVPRERVLQMPAELRGDLGYRRSSAGLGMCAQGDPGDYLMSIDAANGAGA